MTTYSIYSMYSIYWRYTLYTAPIIIKIFIDQSSKEMCVVGRGGSSARAEKRYPILLLISKILSIDYLLLFIVLRVCILFQSTYKIPSPFCSCFPCARRQIKNFSTFIPPLNNK